MIYDHLAGRHTEGIYPLLKDDTCAVISAGEELGGACRLGYVTIWPGAHGWIFFASRVSVRDARCQGSAIISNTCACTKQLKLGSYDRLFPNQDSVPKGGFDNLIALPVQKGPKYACPLWINSCKKV